MKNSKTAGWISTLALALVMMNSRQATASGNWLRLANNAPASVQLMILLSDGTVLAANNPVPSAGFAWYRLRPDPNGHYVLGEWSEIPGMQNARLYFSSQLLPDGRLFVAGGEYGSGKAKAEIYDPVTNGWTQIDPPSSLLNPSLGEGFFDSESKVLPDGTVLVAPVAPSVNTGNSTLIYDPKNGWSRGPQSLSIQDETSWVKLPDGSVLTVDHDQQTSERYIPELKQWIPDRNVPVNLWANLAPVAVGETGPAFLLPNGKAFFLGGLGHTAFYTPSGTTNLGNWAPGPDLPNGFVVADAPGAMMPNGKILFAATGAPIVSGTNVVFAQPTSFFEFDYTAGTNGAFTQVSGPVGLADNIVSYGISMLVLPDGSVLFADSSTVVPPATGGPLWVYVPSDSNQLTLGNEPVITSITSNPDGSFHLTGTGLNGLSEGAAFGDDEQMNSNFPLVEFIDNDNGQVDYARTYNWSSTGVQMGSAVQTTEFTIPAGLVPKSYLVKVTASGVTSAPVTFSFVIPNSLSLCPGESGSLSVITSPQPASYQWLFNGNPLLNQTNAQLNFVAATTNQSGLYSLKISSGNGAYISSPVQVSVGVWVIFPPPPENSAPLCQPNILSVIAQGKGPLNASWYRNGKLIIPDSRISTNSAPQSGGGTTLTLNFADIKYQDDGTYAVTITDDCGPLTTAPFTMRVIPNPPWIQVATSGPSPRWDAAMAYDSDRHVTVLFGGAVYSPVGSPVLGDTWEFDGTNWAQRLPATSPIARSLANMVYDSDHHRSVLYGGTVYTGFPLTSAYSPETWEWDGTNWQKIATANLPTWTNSAGSGYAACYDIAHKEMLLFGGITSTGIVSQLWGYNGTNWNVKSPAGAAPIYSLISTTMAFDANRGMAVLVGPVGTSAPNFRGQSVWEWDGSAWNERPQSGQQPTLNTPNNAFAYDTFRQECVLYGFEQGLVDGVFTDSLYPYPDDNRLIWRWNGQQWQADPPTPTAGVAYHLRHSMCFDSAHNAMVVFGGQLGTADSATNYTYEMIYQDDPAVLKQPTVQVSLLGQQVQLSILGAGAPPIGYQWQKGIVNLTDGGRVSGSSSNTLTINAAEPADSGYYQVGLSNICGMAVSLPILLNVTAGPTTVAIGALSSSGTNMVITWSERSALLQSTTNLAGPWTAIAGATSPYQFNPFTPGRFFRLMYP